ncbi:hypothetical protein JXA88_07605 [Candidatus Fermentibacteria bacterium]|nr:hypothetical protein [Candidatus Fermentibacteria bacterium]
MTVGIAVGLLPLVFLGAAGCSTRESTPIVAADSTVVYPSKISNDVQVSITFALKGSKRREEQQRLERARQRQIERERKERDAKERAQRAKAKKKPSSSKSKKPVKKATKPTAYTSKAPATAPSRAESADSMATSAAASKAVTTPLESSPSLPPDERVFELEEGARVQATMRIENPYGRGTRPVMFHTVWLNPEGKRVFKKMTEWTPNDTSQVFTTSLTIPPSRRTAGQYELQVFLFRELIASKTIQLTGESTALQEKDDTGGM